MSNPLENLAVQYLEIKDTIDALTAEAKEVRGKIDEEMEPDGGLVLTFPNAVIARVKGRVTKKLDRKKLVTLGVSGTLLDQGTITTTGVPSLRITKPKEEANAA